MVVRIVESGSSQVRLCGCGCGQRTMPAKRTDRRKGMVQGEPLKFAPGHAGRMNPKTYFWSRIEVTESGCWEWTQYVNAQGYGRCTLQGRTEPAHRAAYRVFKGDPEGGFVCHTCDNPPCVNPDHLYLGDNDTNMRDKAIRERHPFLKVTRDQVNEIRSRRAAGERLKAIAADYDMSESAICAITTGRRRTA